MYLRYASLPHRVLSRIIMEMDANRMDFDYAKAKDDPHPDVLVLGDFNNPDTGNNLIGGINLHYLKDDEVQSLRDNIQQIMTGTNLKERFRIGEQLLPDIFGEYYRTYDTQYINQVTPEQLPTWEPKMMPQRPPQWPAARPQAMRPQEPALPPEVPPGGVQEPSWPSPQPTPPARQPGVPQWPGMPPKPPGRQVPQEPGVQQWPGMPPRPPRRPGMPPQQPGMPPQQSATPPQQPLDNVDIGTLANAYKKRVGQIQAQKQAAYQHELDIMAQKKLAKEREANLRDLSTPADEDPLEIRPESITYYSPRTGQYITEQVQLWTTQKK